MNRTTTELRDFLHNPPSVQNGHPSRDVEGVMKIVGHYKEVAAVFRFRLTINSLTC